jgi:hypothetical protein
MNALEELLSDLKEVCARLEDKRLGQGYLYTMADIGLAAGATHDLITNKPQPI